MALDPDVAEQQLIAEGWERRPVRLSVDERRSELLLGAAYCAAAAVVALIAPFHAASIHVAAAALCAVGVALAMRIEFYAGGGFTVPTQLAFVPLLFALPPALVPPIVIAAGVASKVPDVVSGRRQVTRLLLTVNNSWFAIGPAAVLGIAGVPDASAAGPVLLAAAFGAQFAGDFAASAVREAMLRGASLREQLGELWVYAVDIGLTPAGVLAGVHVREQPWSVLALLPMLAVLATFARERQARVASLVELSNAYRGTALVLGDVIEADDGYTGTHSRSVVELAIAVGEHLGLDASRRRNLEFGALLHDVGKIAIPKEIINKPGKLDPDEWAVIKTHTVEGQAMLDRVGGFMREVGKIVRSHHERWDGLGYPDGLSGHDIPIEARIIACCDSFNAMTTTRAYRAAMSHDAALTELRSNAGLQFDPDIVDATVAVITAPEPARAEARRHPVEFAPMAAPAT